MVVNKGTELTPAMRAAVARKKANNDPLHSALKRVNEGDEVVNPRAHETRWTPGRWSTGEDEGNV